MLDVRGLPPTYWILWTGALINRLGGFVMPLLALYLTGGRGLSVEQAGLVVSLYGAGALLSGPLGGFFADHPGRRRTLVAGLVLGALAMLHLAFARTALHIGAAAFLLGLFGEVYRPVISAAIADVVPAQDRARAYGILYWAVNLGFAVGSALGGALSQYGWTLLFVAAAAATLVAAGFGLTALARPLPGYVAAIAVWPVGEVVMAGIGPAVGPDAAPAARRGASQALFHMSLGVASLTAPAVGSFVLGWFG